MKSLLRTILDECEKHKLMYRANACELWNHGLYRYDRAMGI
jgi:hypothetical protein